MGLHSMYARAPVVTPVSNGLHCNTAQCLNTHPITNGMCVWHVRGQVILPDAGRSCGAVGHMVHGHFNWVCMRIARTVVGARVGVEGGAVLLDMIQG